MESKNITEIRKEINSIDEDLLRLFVRRLEIVGEVAASKKERGVPVFDPAREREILTRVADKVGPDLENEASLFFSTIFSISRGRQREELFPDPAFKGDIERAIAAAPERFPTTAAVACQGTEGAYSQQAASLMFAFPTILYFQTFEDVFAAVDKGLCKYGVLPIENSAAGSVTAVYDLMAKHKFKIVRAWRLRVKHVLLALPGDRGRKGDCKPSARSCAMHAIPARQSANQGGSVFEHRGGGQGTCRFRKKGRCRDRF